MGSNLFNALRRVSVPALSRALAAGGASLARKLLGPSTEQRKQALIALIDKVEQQQAGTGRPKPLPGWQDFRRREREREREREQPPFDEPEPVELDPRALPLQMVPVSSSNIHSIGWR